MAERAGDGTWAEQRRPFTMRALWRLAIWGTAAAASLLVAVLAGYSDTGSQRLMAARAAPGGIPAPLPNAAQIARDLDVETRRLAEVVRYLTADRDQLAIRVDSLERNLEDATGSIKPQAALSNATPGAGSSASAPAAPAPAQPKAAAVPPESLPTIPARPPSPAAELPPGAGEGVAPAAAAGDEPGSEPGASKAEFGVEIGGAAGFEGLRALWIATNSRHAALFEGLHPVVAARENSRTKAVELRLIVGPLANAEAAERLCATLAGARRHCQPVAFEGKRLAQADAAPERKPAPGQRSTPAPKSAWPFR